MNITMKDIGIFLWKNLGLIVAAALLGAFLAAGITCAFVAPEYTATAKLYVSNEKSNSGYISQGDLAVSKSLVDTCLILAESTPVLEEAVQKLAVSYPDISVKEVAERLTGSAIRATEAFSLSATDPDGQKAADIVNTIVELLPGEIMRVTKAASVEIIEMAKVPDADEHNWPLVRNAALGGFLGLLAAVGFVLASGTVDATVYGRKELTRHFRIPIIGAIPGRIGREPVLPHPKADPGVTEAYRLARTYITQFSAPGKCVKIVITSPTDGEGKSCCSIGLAAELAQMGKKVLLVDGNLRKPQIAEYLQLPKCRGLAEYLAGTEESLPVVHSEGIGADVLTAGEASFSGGALLSTPRMEQLLEQAAAVYDYILLDTPALLSAADAAVLAKKTDGYLLSVMAGTSNVEKVKEAVRLLEQLDAAIWGLVVHNVDPETEKYGRYIRWKSKGIRMK